MNRDWIGKLLRSVKSFHMPIPLGWYADVQVRSIPKRSHVFWMKSLQYWNLDHCVLTQEHHINRLSYQPKIIVVSVDEVVSFSGKTSAHLLNMSVNTRIYVFAILFYSRQRPHSTSISCQELEWKSDVIFPNGAQAFLWVLPLLALITLLNLMDDVLRVPWPVVVSLKFLNVLFLSK